MTKQLSTGKRDESDITSQKRLTELAGATELAKCAKKTDFIQARKDF